MAQLNEARGQNRVIEGIRLFMATSSNPTNFVSDGRMNWDQNQESAVLLTFDWLCNCGEKTIMTNELDVFVIASSVSEG